MSPREALGLLGELEAIDVGERHAAAVAWATDLVRGLDASLAQRGLLLNEVLINLDDDEIAY